MDCTAVGSLSMRPPQDRIWRGRMVWRECTAFEVQHTTPNADGDGRLLPLQLLPVLRYSLH
jgi:hypothetical protein